VGNIISIDDIKDNMLLAEPVINNFGQTLLPKGVTLFDKHIRLLKTWNIKYIAIMNENENDENLPSPEVLKIAEEHYNERVKWEIRNTIERDMLQTAILLFGKKYLKNIRD
jgi:hypothetical protein